MVYNMMTCQGGDWTFAVLGGCSMAWIAFAFLVFVILIARRQADDGFLAGMGFSFIGAIVGGLGANVVLTTLFGSARWSLLGGLLGVIVGGFVLGMFFGDGGYE